ncbi:MAG: putative bifunctional diguanylate cyclase/phosphodiesterase [Thermoleophilia bacterium]
MTQPGRREYRLLFERVPATVLVLDPRLCIVGATDEYLEATHTRREEIVGRLLFEVFPDNPEDPSATGVTNLRLSLERVLETRRTDTMAVQKYDIPVPASDRFETRYWAPENRPIVAADGSLSLILHCVEDVTERVLRTAVVENLGRDLELVRHAALHDGLTGLPNRTLAVDRLEMALASRRRDGDGVAVLMIDFDRFKTINDSFGHQAGDELLAALGSRLTGAVRSNDTVARLGGDEFVVICDAKAGIDNVVLVAERILRAIAAPIVARSGEHDLSASIGIVLADATHGSAAELLRDADAAMYRAKQRGGGRYEVFNEALRRRTFGRVQTAAELRRAIAGSDQLRVHYQPIIDLETGDTVGTEALVRWAHPARGLLQPDDFLAVAEETGLIRELGQWVLAQAIGQTVEWQRRYDRPLQIAVNVSPRQLADADFPDRAAEIAEATGVHQGSLHLEIGEEALMEDAVTSSACLTRLREQGVGLVVDRFGSGYASLSHLDRLAPDGVKVDRSFTRGVGSDERRNAIVSAVIQMSQALGVTLVAEGVETDSQREHLRQMGCGRAQGHLWSSAVPAEGIRRLLDGRFTTR